MKSTLIIRSLVQLVLIFIFSNLSLATEQPEIVESVLATYTNVYSSETCVAKMSGDFNGHLKYSNSPGIDIAFADNCIDTQEYTTFPFADYVPYLHFPVLSPVNGDVFLSGPGKHGTVIIKDSSGYFHKLLHNNIFPNGDLIEAYIPLYLLKHMGVDIGSTVTKGQHIAYLGHTLTPKDHVHYAIYQDIGSPGQKKYQWFDPAQVTIDYGTGSVIDPGTVSCISEERKFKVEKCTNSRTFLYLEGIIHEIDQVENPCGKSMVKGMKITAGENSGSASVDTTNLTWEANIPTPTDTKTVLLQLIGLNRSIITKLDYSIKDCTTPPLPPSELAIVTSNVPLIMRIKDQHWW